MNKKNKNLFYWLLYDSGNSFIMSVIGGLYLAQWLVLDKGVPEVWYGTTFSIATVFVLLTSPVFGTWSDRLGERKRFINAFTAVIAIASLLMVFATNTQTNSSWLPIFVLVLFFLIQYAYQLSLVFFNALLDKLSNKKTRGKVSGLSMLYNQIAYVASNAVLLPFALGKITLFGITGRPQVFLPAFIIFFILSSLFVFKFKEKRVVRKVNARAIDVMKNTIKGIKLLYHKEKNVGLFLLGFSFVSDALLTISLYFALIMNELYKIPDVKKLIVITVMFLFAGIGGYLTGKIADKRGVKSTFLLMIICLIVAFSIAFLSSNFLALLVTMIFAGIGWGGFYSLSRTMLVAISPKERLGEYFGFYSTFERFASIIGPTLWGITIFLLNRSMIIKYRVAGFSQIVLMIVGAYILRQVSEKNGVKMAKNQ